MPKDLQIQNTIFTDRLNLEILNVDDYDFIKSLVNSKGWIENIGDRNVHSKNDAIAYVNKILASEDLFYWVVRINDSNTPIGIISFLKRSYLENFDIGFAFLPQFQGSGYAYEATVAVLGGFQKLPTLDIILATTKVSNQSSIKLLIKLGFRPEKELEIDNQKLLIYTNATLT